MTETNKDTSPTNKIVSTATEATLSASAIAKRKARLATVPDFHKSKFVRAWSGKSRDNAIKAFCLECIGFDRSAITTCTAPACPLWPYRPYQKGQEESE